jgi:tetratricopeptide (TPR) repeat protein
VAAFEGTIARCAELSIGRWTQLLGALMRLGRYAQAAPLAQRLLAHTLEGSPRRARLAAAAGRALLETGRPAEAEGWLLEARRLGAGDCRVLTELAETARARGDLASASSSAEQAFDCGGGRDASLLLAAATWALDDANPERAAQLLVRVGDGTALSADQRGQLDLLERRLAGGAVDPEVSTPVFRGR